MENLELNGNHSSKFTVDMPSSFSFWNSRFPSAFTLKNEHNSLLNSYKHNLEERQDYNKAEDSHIIRTLCETKEMCIEFFEALGGHQPHWKRHDNFKPFYWHVSNINKAKDISTLKWYLDNVISLLFEATGRSFEVSRVVGGIFSLLLDELSVFHSVFPSCDIYLSQNFSDSVAHPIQTIMDLLDNYYSFFLEQEHSSNNYSNGHVELSTQINSQNETLIANSNVTSINVTTKKYIPDNVLESTQHYNPNTCTNSTSSTDSSASRSHSRDSTASSFKPNYTAKSINTSLSHPINTPTSFDSHASISYHTSKSIFSTHNNPSSSTSISNNFLSSTSIPAFTPPSDSFKRNKNYIGFISESLSLTLSSTSPSTSTTSSRITMVPVSSSFIHKSPSTSEACDQHFKESYTSQSSSCLNTSISLPTLEPNIPSTRSHPFPQESLSFNSVSPPFSSQNNSISSEILSSIPSASMLSFSNSTDDSSSFNFSTTSSLSYSTSHYPLKFPKDTQSISLDNIALHTPEVILDNHDSPDPSSLNLLDDIQKFSSSPHLFPKAVYKLCEQTLSSSNQASFLLRPLRWLLLNKPYLNGILTPREIIRRKCEKFLRRRSKKLANINKSNIGRSTPFQNPHITTFPQNSQDSLNISRTASLSHLKPNLLNSNISSSLLDQDSLKHFQSNKLMTNKTIKKDNHRSPYNNFIPSEQYKKISNERHQLTPQQDFNQDSKKIEEHSKSPTLHIHSKIFESKLNGLNNEFLEGQSNLTNSIHSSSLSSPIYNSSKRSNFQAETSCFDSSYEFDKKSDDTNGKIHINSQKEMFRDDEITTTDSSKKIHGDSTVELDNSTSLDGSSSSLQMNSNHFEEIQSDENDYDLLLYEEYYCNPAFDLPPYSIPSTVGYLDQAEDYLYNNSPASSSPHYLLYTSGMSTQPQPTSSPLSSPQSNTADPYFASSVAGSREGLTSPSDLPNADEPSSQTTNLQLQSKNLTIQPSRPDTISISHPRAGRRKASANDHLMIQEDPPPSPSPSQIEDDFQPSRHRRHSKKDGIYNNINQVHTNSVQASTSNSNYYPSNPPFGHPTHLTNNSSSQPPLSPTSSQSPLLDGSSSSSKIPIYQKGTSTAKPTKPHGTTGRGRRIEDEIEDMCGVFKWNAQDWEDYHETHPTESPSDLADRIRLKGLHSSKSSSTGTNKHCSNDNFDDQHSSNLSKPPPKRQPNWRAWNKGWWTQFIPKEDPPLNEEQIKQLLKTLKPYKSVGYSVQGAFFYTLWRTKDGEGHRRAFSVSRLGFYEARRQAVNFLMCITRRPPGVVLDTKSRKWSVCVTHKNERFRASFSLAKFGIDGAHLRALEWYTQKRKLLGIQSDSEGEPLDYEFQEGTNDQQTPQLGLILNTLSSAPSSPQASHSSRNFENSNFLQSSNPPLSPSMLPSTLVKPDVETVSPSHFKIKYNNLDSLHDPHLLPASSLQIHPSTSTEQDPMSPHNHISNKQEIKNHNSLNPSSEDNLIPSALSTNIPNSSLQPNNSNPVRLKRVINKLSPTETFTSNHESSKFSQDPQNPEECHLLENELTINKEAPLCADGQPKPKKQRTLTARRTFRMKVKSISEEQKRKEYSHLNTNTSEQYLDLPLQNFSSTNLTQKQHSSSPQSSYMGNFSSSCDTIKITGSMDTTPSISSSSPMNLQNTDLEGALKGMNFSQIEIGKEPLSNSVELQGREKVKSGLKLLYSAISKKEYDIVKKLVRRGGLDLNQFEECQLKATIYDEDTRMIESLFSGQSKPVVSREILFSAAYTNNLPIFKSLLNHTQDKEFLTQNAPEILKNVSYIVKQEKSFNPRLVRWVADQLIKQLGAQQAFQIYLASLQTFAHTSPYHLSKHQQLFAHILPKFTKHINLPTMIDLFHGSHYYCSNQTTPQQRQQIEQIIIDQSTHTPN